jgi:hypothetical protein
MKIFGGDFSVIIGKEDIFKLAYGNEFSGINNDNRVRLVNLPYLKT